MLPKERVVHDHRQPPWIRHEHLERYRFASRLVSGQTVVDCACGDGTGTELLARAGAGRVHGFDVSPEAVATARATTDGTQAEIELADAHALPLPDRSVDVYVSLETIEHVEHPDRLLDEVVRVLRDDGTLVCSTPNRDVYSPGHSEHSKPWNPFHVREFDSDELAALVSDRFAELTLYGQNDRNRFRAGFLRIAGRVLPWDATVRLRQLAKLPLIAFDSEDRHRVRPIDPSRPPEILIAVCRTPLRQESLAPG